MNKNPITRAIQAATIMSVASLTAFSAIADQETASIERQTQTSNANSAQDQDLERITVTGSHIKRLDIEGPSPLEIITSADIQALGLDTMTEVLQSLTANNGSMQTNLDNGSTSRSATTVNLRGIGENRTLVLVDGVRVPKFPGSFGGSRNAFDLNVLPSEAIERVEILHGGASAIYGSDAMGGVVNFILKKKYDGTKVKGSYQDTTRGGGERSKLSLTTGFQLGETDNLLVLEYQKKETLQKKEREWTSGHGVKNNNWYSSWGAYFRDYSKLFTDGRNIPNEEECGALFGSEARYVPGYWDGRVYQEEIDSLKAQGIDPASDEGLAHLAQFGLTETTYKCRYNSLSGTDSLYPGYDKFNLTFHNSWDIDDNWQLSNSFSFYHRTSIQRGDPARHSTASIYRNADNGNLVYADDRLDGVDYDRFQIRRAMPEFGDENQDMKNEAWNWTSALSGTVGEYDLTITATYGRATRHRESGRGNVTRSSIRYSNVRPK